MIRWEHLLVTLLIVGGGLVLLLTGHADLIGVFLMIAGTAVMITDGIKNGTSNTSKSPTGN